MPRALLQKDGKVEEIRAFNRFYAERMGFMSEVLSDEFCLTELRVLAEIYLQKSTSATNISHETGIDTGYLSRILKRLERKGLVKRKALVRDGRVRELTLSAEGLRIYTSIAQKMAETIDQLLTRLTEDEQRRLLGAMDEIQRLLKKP